MRELVERRIEEGRIVDGKPAARTGRRVTVNLAESPLGWLRARRRITARQFEAGERLRADYEMAAMGVRVTMRWDVAPALRRTGAPGEVPDPTLMQIAAKRRFDDAIAAAGPGLADIAWRVICAGESLPGAERAMGWPTRSGRLVLTLALDRVADHYRLP